MKSGHFIISMPQDTQLFMIERNKTLSFSIEKDLTRRAVFILWECKAGYARGGDLFGEEKKE